MFDALRALVIGKREEAQTAIIARAMAYWYATKSGEMIDLRQQALMQACAHYAETLRARHR